MARLSGYFSIRKVRQASPGEIVIARLLLLWGGGRAIYLICYDAIAYSLDAHQVGVLVGRSLPSLCGIAIALLMRPGRRWTRWAAMIVAAFWCIFVIQYAVAQGPARIVDFMPSVLMFTAVNLIGAREYFTRTP